MGRGERDVSNHNDKRQALKRSIKSDDSDEDYLLEEDEADDHSDELESLCGDVSEEESLGNFVDEEENEMVRKTVRSNVQKRSKGRMKTGINRSSKKLKRTYDEEVDDDDYHTEEDDEDYHLGEDDEDYHEEVDDEDYHEEEEDGGGGERFWGQMKNRKKRSARKTRRRTSYDFEENGDYGEKEGGVGSGDGERSVGQKKIRTNGSLKKRKRIAYHDEDDVDYPEEEDDEDYCEEEDDEDHHEEEDGGERSMWQVKNGINRSSEKRKSIAHDKEESDADYLEEEDVDVGERLTDHAENGNIKSSKKRKRKSYDVEEDDEDYHEEENDADGGGGSDDDDNDYNDDDEDDEFTPEDLDFLEEEEDLPSSEERKKKNGWRSVKRKGSQISRKRKTGGQLPRKRGQKKRRESSRSSKSTSGRRGKSMKKAPSSRSRSRRMPVSRKKKAKPHSDSDFVSSASSDHEFTISEEEREQVREANELCLRLNTNLRSSEKDQENEAHNQLRDLPRRKGKEKVEETKGDIGKQVCGICLTEEGKATIRGTLDCCNHFFCFACIIEWSKVESRCPLCKQRFLTISKPPRSATRIDTRDVVIHVPERDQVYQPSEEELRDYLDPYENVICSECHEGGDDALMLLCDLCDSPAHTYCVGLGQEVPEGNWYCEGCRPAALGFASAQAQHHTPTQRANNSTSDEPPTFENMAEIDLNISIPETPVTPANGFLVSPRQPSGGGFQPPIPVSGVGVSTLSGRRMVQRFLHTNNRFNHMASRVDRNTTSDRMTNFPSSWVDQAVQPSSTETAAAEIGTSYRGEYLDRLPENLPGPTQNGESFPGRLGLMRGQVLQVPSAADGSSYGCVQVGGVGRNNMGLNCIPGREYLQPCTSSFNMVSGPHSASLVYNKDLDQNAAKQQIKSLVKAHLRNLCRDMNLGQDTLNQIGWSSCHTISAVCGFDHLRAGVHQVQPPICLHAQQTSLMMGCCQGCFDTFVRDVVRMVVESRVPQQLGFRNY